MKKQALALHLEIDLSLITEISETTFTYDNKLYTVLNESEYDKVKCNYDTCYLFKRFGNELLTCNKGYLIPDEEFYLFFIN